MRAYQRTIFSKAKKKVKVKPKAPVLPRQVKPVLNIRGSKIAIKPSKWNHDGIPCSGFVVTNRTNTILIGKIFYQVISPHVAKIRYRKVNPKLRGKGVGSQILAYLEEHLRDLRFRQSTVKTRQGDTALFFLRNGYSIIEMKNIKKIPLTLVKQRALIEKLMARQGTHINQVTLVKEL